MSSTKYKIKRGDDPNRIYSEKEPIIPVAIGGITGRSGGLISGGYTGGGSTGDETTYDNTKLGDTDEGKTAWEVYQGYLNQYNNFGDFGFSKQGDLDSVYSNIKNYGDFSYDVNSDALYQQYANQYIQQGKMAMQDTIGQASAMTGGYGNSYAATAGNQAYQGYLQQLNDKVPELYQLALNKWQMGKNDLYDQYGMLLSEYEREYGLYSDEYNQLLDQLSLARSDYYGSSSAGNDTSIVQNNSIPDSIIKKAESYASNASLANYLDGLVASGVITETQADQVYAQYADDNEKYVINEDGTTGGISYQGMVGSTQGWSVEDDGGANWFWGVDNNARVKAPNGEIIRLDDLTNKLIAEGMSASEAKKAIKTLQKNLGI